VQAAAVLLRFFPLDHPNPMNKSCRSPKKDTPSTPAQTGRSKPFVLPTLQRKELPDWFFNMIPRRAVRSVFFPSGIPQNAIWDFARSPEGRFYASLCAEGFVSASARLYEFLPDQNRLEFLLDMKRECLVGPRAIPPSKIHTSMDFTKDGELILATHTTAPAPDHPYWLFDAYYSHQWEGYAGSHVLLHNPATGVTRNLGIPMPRESIYGGVYEPRRHAYYFIGYSRGHVGRLDLETREVKDLGQGSEFGSYRLTLGPDGNIYYTTRSGWLFRVDVDRDRIENLNQRLPTPEWWARKQYTYGRIGPDGRLYMANQVSDRLVALDVKTLRAEDCGPAEPEPRVKTVFPRSPIGLAFDDDGVLWYTMGSEHAGMSGLWIHLARWDVARGGKPEIVGMLGTAEHALWYASELIHANGKLYASDTNHGEDPPGILTIDLATLKSDLSSPREKCCDPAAYMLIDEKDGAAACPAKNYQESRKVYRAMMDRWMAWWKFLDENPYFIQAKKTDIVRLWQKLPNEDTRVTALEWESNRKLRGVCGMDSSRHDFVIQDGQLIRSAPIDDASREEWNLPSANGLDRLPTGIEKLRLPNRQGRHFLAKPSCWTPWNGGRILVGTADGMLAIVHPKKRTVFSLGAVAPHGPVHQIVTNARRTMAYGVAGDPNDMGHLFRFTDTGGVAELGRTFTAENKPPGSANSCEPRCLALSPDEKTLAIGVADQLGAIYLYTGLK
jgi:streptogramin lyase